MNLSKTFCREIKTGSNSSKSYQKSLFERKFFYPKALELSPQKKRVMGNLLENCSEKGVGSVRFVLISAFKIASFGFTKVLFKF